MNRRDALHVAALGAVAAAGGYGLGRLHAQNDSDPEVEALGRSTDAAHSPERDRAEILMLVYPRFTALDLVGPQHVFSLLGPDYKTRLVWKDTADVTSDTGIPVRPTQTFEEATESPEVLFVPGGTDGTLAVMEDPEVLGFLASRGANARYVTSVCTGSLVLAAAGLLRDRRATTHWLAMEALADFGVQAVSERVVVDGNRITGAGVTAGTDFALTLAAALKDDAYAQGIQLMMEYDPAPPFGGVTPESADPETVGMLRAMALEFNRTVKAVAGRRGTTETLSAPQAGE